MALWILIISAILFLITFIGIKKPILQYSISGLFLIISIVMSCFLMLNDNSHFGMKLVTQTTTTKIASVSKNKQLGLLIYKQLGTGNERVYIYRPANSDKTTHTQIKYNTTNNVVQNNNIKTPELVTKTQKYTYKNNFWKVMFIGLSLDKEIYHRTNTFNIPSNWYVVSTNQLQQLEQKLKAAAIAKQKAAMLKKAQAAQQK